MMKRLLFPCALLLVSAVSFFAGRLIGGQNAYHDREGRLWTTRTATVG